MLPRTHLCFLHLISSFRRGGTNTPEKKKSPPTPRVSVWTRNQRRVTSLHFLLFFKGEANTSCLHAAAMLDFRKVSLGGAAVLNLCSSLNDLCWRLYYSWRLTTFNPSSSCRCSHVTVVHIKQSAVSCSTLCSLNLSLYFSVFYTQKWGPEFLLISQWSEITVTSDFSLRLTMETHVHLCILKTVKWKNIQEVYMTFIDTEKLQRSRAWRSWHRSASYICMYLQSQD